MALLLAAFACAAAPVPSFANDVIPVFTRFGCNQGACHGKGAGQNGFRLSLRGYAPELDYQWLTREFNGRRIAGQHPDDSLLLRKPLGLSPHEGGKIFGRDSQAYRVLADWLAAGVPGPAAKEAHLKTLTLDPAGATCRANETKPLRATATYDDGSTRDVTWLCKFDTNDAAVANVSAEGVVIAKRAGETAIRAAFQSEVAVAVVSVPHATAIDASKYQHGSANLIDGPLFAKLQQLRIEPAGLCGDAEFIRRVCLDAAGVLPTPTEVASFLADRDPGKRAKLIDATLARPEFTDTWTRFLADLLQNRKERDHDVRGTKGVRAFHDWLREQVAANRPWNELARAVLTASGSSDETPAVGYYIVTVGEHRDPEKSEVVGSVAQSFLGTRIGCAQCHNHPLERYTQDDYYHFAAFFSRVKLDRKESKSGPTMLRVARPDANENKRPVGVHQPRTGAFLAPQSLDRAAPAIKPGEDPRAALAAWVTDPKNEAFAGAMVNRVWKHFFSTALVEPVDDLRATNPPSNPVLWQALGREFVTNGYDLKKLIRLLLNSRAYQLASATTPGNATDTRFYSHYYARRLPAEVLADALCQTTGVPDSYPGYPLGVRAGQLPDPTMKSYFLGLFGRSERVTACACERNGEVTIPQVLHLQNGDVQAKVRASDGSLAKLLAREPDNRKLADELFLLTLARQPADAERAAVQAALADGDRADAFRDLFWALLNSKEFLFNR